MLDDADDLRRRLASPALVASLLGLSADPVEMAQRRRRASTRVMVLCPAHGERTASCSLTVGADGTLAVHCFGAGGRCLDGDVFTLIAAVYRIDAFRDVLAEARRLAGVSPYTAVRARPPPPPAPPVSEPQRLSDPDFGALLAPLLKGATLRRQPDVALYLSRRLLLAEAEADGWAAPPPPPGQARWIEHLCATAPGGREAVGRSGLVPLDPETDEPTFHRFAQPGARIIIPWRHASGALATVQRRRLDAGGEGRPRYVAARGRPPGTLYGIERVTLDARKPLTIVEGAVDVLALRTLLRLAHAPAEDVVGLPGTSAWRSDLLPPCKGRVVHVATDRDAAGEACAKIIAADVSRAGGIPVRLTPAAPSKDWGEVLERLSARVPRDGSQAA